MSNIAEVWCFLINKKAPFKVVIKYYIKVVFKKVVLNVSHLISGENEAVYHHKTNYDHIFSENSTHKLSHINILFDLIF